MRDRNNCVPTGVADFDSIVAGGFPSGSVVLLVGEPGAGQTEFVLTSAAKLSMVKENPASRGFLMGGSTTGLKLPERICYVTFSRSREEILQEIGAAFNEEFHDAFERVVQFKDFSDSYFRRTVVPRSWAGETSSVFSAASGENVLNGLVEFLDKNAEGSMVIIDSLTDLVLSANIDTGDLVAVLRGLKRVSKKWGGIIYLVLTADVLDDRKQRMIMDSVDGSLVFEWSKFISSSKRQRYIYVEKFISLLPHLEKERIARFATIVTSKSGLVVIDTERVA